jgi:hypothetical protein
MLVGILTTFGIGALTASSARAENQREGAERRCNQQRGCTAIHENNGDLVIIVNDVDGDGKGDGVIRCPAGTTTCTAMSKVPPSKNPFRAAAAVTKKR